MSNDATVPGTVPGGSPGLQVPSGGRLPPARHLLRALLAGPAVFFCAAAVMAGGALWVPPGAAGIDNLVLPIVLFPAIWALLFFYACLDRRLGRAWLLTLALLALNAAMIAHRFLGQGAGA